MYTVQVSRIHQGHRPRSQLQALWAYAAYTLLTWKWPGCFDVFAPAQLFCQLMSSNGLISRYKCLTKYLISLQPQAFCDALYARNSFLAGAAPRTCWGSSRRSPRTPSRMGRGKPPPHSPPPSTATASRSRCPEFHFPKVGNPIGRWYVCVLHHGSNCFP